MGGGGKQRSLLLEEQIERGTLTPLLCEKDRTVALPAPGVEEGGEAEEELRRGVSQDRGFRTVREWSGG